MTTRSALGSHPFVGLAEGIALGPVSGRTLEHTMVTLERAIATGPVTFDVVLRYVECVVREVERARGPREHARALRLVSRCAKRLRRLECPPDTARDLRSMLVDALLRTWPTDA
jgi:hypothetical protein